MVVWPSAVSNGFRCPSLPQIQDLLPIQDIIGSAHENSIFGVSQITSQRPMMA
jgi:hypothetical protein